jgi:hypothetical protein
MSEESQENSHNGQSALELAQTALVKNQRERVDHSPLSVQPPPDVITHGPSVVVDPFAPVMRRNLPAEEPTLEDTAATLALRVAELEAEGRAKDARIAELETAVSGLEVLSRSAGVMVGGEGGRGA